MKRLILIGITILFSYCIMGNSRSQSPLLETNQLNYFKMQYAGNLGLLSLGIGKTYFSNRLNVDLNYGYLPKLANSEQVHTFAIKSGYYFFKAPVLKIPVGGYAGASVTYSITNNTYAKYPNHYPKGYYDLANAFHVNPFLGVSLDLHSNKNKRGFILLFAEIGTVDYLIWNDIRNRKISGKDIWNLSMGFAITF